MADNIRISITTEDGVDLSLTPEQLKHYQEHKDDPMTEAGREKYADEMMAFIKEKYGSMEKEKLERFKVDMLKN